MHDDGDQEGLPCSFPTPPLLEYVLASASGLTMLSYGGHKGGVGGAGGEDGGNGGEAGSGCTGGLGGLDGGRNVEVSHASSDPGSTLFGATRVSRRT